MFDQVWNTGFNTSSDLEVNSETMRRRETESRSIYKAKSWSKLAWTTLEHLIKFELHIWAEQCHEATTTITSLILLSVSASQGLQPTPPSVWLVCELIITSCNSSSCNNRLTNVDSPLITSSQTCVDNYSCCTNCLCFTSVYPLETELLG